MLTVETQRTQRSLWTGTAKTLKTLSKKCGGRILALSSRTSFFKTWRIGGFVSSRLLLYNAILRCNSKRLECRQADTAFCGIYSNRNSSFRDTLREEDLWPPQLFS